MKSLNELLTRFNDIQDIPVSEEMLGAYMEGTLQGTEFDKTAEQISSNSALKEIVNNISEDNISNSTEESHQWEIHEGDNGYLEIGLPPVPSPSDTELDDYTENIDDFSMDSDRNQVRETLSLQNNENSLDDTQLNSSSMANNSKTIIYGEAAENNTDPVFVQQPDDHSCALRSQQIVLRDFGIDIPFKDLEQIALDHQIYTNEGTYTYDIGKVLQLAGVGIHQTTGNTVDDLINELAQGHRVIVSVDANELWYNKTIGDKLKNWFEDAIGHQGGNHALIVAGFELNPSHPENNKVILTDSGSGDLRIEYPMGQFKKAWGDSNCFMAATNDPAPYQYDVETGMEVPSNFAVQQYINDFVANNSYQLSPDMINIPEGYQPAFVDHIDIVGDIDYDSFKADYDAMIAKRIPSSLSVEEQIEDVAKRHEELNPNNDNVTDNTSGTTDSKSIGTERNASDKRNQSDGGNESQDEDNEESFDENNPIGETSPSSYDDDSQKDDRRVEEDDEEEDEEDDEEDEEY